MCSDQMTIGADQVALFKFQSEATQGHVITIADTKRFGASRMIVLHDVSWKDAMTICAWCAFFITVEPSFTLEPLLPYAQPDLFVVHCPVEPNPSLPRTLSGSSIVSSNWNLIN